jgi:hypothetical protein
MDGRRVLNRFGDPAKTMLPASAGTQFLADVGFKLKDCEVRSRRKIFSVAESRSRVADTARPEDFRATQGTIDIYTPVMTQIATLVRSRD